MGSLRANHQRLLSQAKLLASHVSQNQHHHALTLFHLMHSSPSLHLDPFVFPLALKSCAALHLPHHGAAIHAHIRKTGLLSNAFVACALVDTYGKCISLPLARQMFDEIPQRNAVVWNAMISLYARRNNVPAALCLFEAMDVFPVVSSYNSIISALSGSNAVECYRQMQTSGVKPNRITVVALLPACVELGALNLIKEMHCFTIRNHIHPHAHLSSGLIEAYGRCGCLSNARRVFDEMLERDVVTWSAMLSAYALHGEAENALSIFQQMELAKVCPNGIVFLGVLKACSHAGLVDKAKEYFTRIQMDYDVEADMDHYSCLIDVLSRAGRLYEAYDVIRGMPMKASAKAWGALLGACRNYGEVGLAEIAAKVLFEIEPDNAGNFVLLESIYARAGKFKEAEMVRREMKERGVKKMPGSSWVISQ